MEWLVLSLASLVATLAVTPALIRLARWLGFVDHPGHRKVHRRTMPVLGGGAIFLGTLLPFAGTLALFRHDAAALSRILFVLGASLTVGAVGLVDDRYPLRGRHKLIAQLAVASAFVAFGYRFVAIDLPAHLAISLGPASLPVTIVWIVAVCNAINLIDGVDGLALSVSAVILGGAAFVSAHLQDRVVLALCLVVLGAILALLRVNWAPARLYLGDCGSLGLGMFVATTLVVLAQTPQAVPVRPGAIPIFEYRLELVSLLVLYPLLEITLSTLRRLIKGKAIGRADREHIHHCLLHRGWTPAGICLGAMVISALAAGGVYATLLRYHAFAALLLALDALLIGFGLHHCGYLERLLRSRVRGIRLAFRMGQQFVDLQELKLQAASNDAEVLAVIHQTCAELGIAHLEIHVEREGRYALDSRWSHPGEVPAATGSDRAADRIALRGSNTWASWTLLDDRPADLEMEHRVLMDELMRDALSKIQNLELDTARSTTDADLAISCHAFAGREGARLDRPEREREATATPLPAALAPRESTGNPT